MAEAQSIRERTAALAERVASRLGCELVDCEYVNQGGNWYLRIYIDRDGGITLDDCSAVSRQLSAALDVEDFVPHSYNLEVSSPGLHRPLRSARDFERFAGERVRIKTYAPIRGKRQFSGVLEGLENETLVILGPTGDRVEIPLERVAKAQLDPELDI